MSTINHSFSSRNLRTNNFILPTCSRSLSTNSRILPTCSRRHQFIKCLTR
ncbi:hypothetical protein RchiOBHm_Chr5g0035511 [Rosa chinensis]|uniref:Uncharacterized protein n=1 Tax=Rosa chinensis TaxID=74649 RepID=A0A2P6QB79_ROSCH|nr:hypothetical protein RchiOBHm_Chr5g0035511 [Rosa chinensis]